MNHSKFNMAAGLIIQAYGRAIVFENKAIVRLNDATSTTPYV